MLPVHALIKDTCARHNCHRTHLYKLSGEGKVLVKKNGRRILVVVASADAHFDSLPTARIKPTKRGAPATAAEARA
jgi:hypothetical protein